MGKMESRLKRIPEVYVLRAREIAQEINRRAENGEVLPHPYPASENYVLRKAIEIGLAQIRSELSGENSLPSPRVSSDDMNMYEKKPEGDGKNSEDVEFLKNLGSLGRHL